MTSRFVAAALIAGLVWCGCGKKEPPVEANVPVGVNLVKNPSFEEWKENVPVDWKLEAFEGQGENVVRHGRDATEKATGQYSFYLRGLFNTQVWQALVQRIPVIPGYRLDFSAGMKGTNLKVGKNQEARANLFVRFYNEKGERVNSRYYADGWTRSLMGTTEWTRLAKLVEIPPEARSADVGLIVQMTGWIFFDDVEVKLVKPVPWLVTETKYVDYYYFAERPFPPGAIERHSARVQEWVKLLGVKLDDKISYYLYPSDTVFKELLGVKKVHDRAVWKKKILHTLDPEDQHEIIHIILNDRGIPPFGLAEGIVFYCIGSWEGRDIHMIAKELLLERRVLPFHLLLSQ